MGFGHCVIGEPVEGSVKQALRQSPRSSSKEGCTAQTMSSGPRLWRAPIIYWNKQTLMLNQHESTIFQEHGHFCCFQTHPYGVGTQKRWLCTYFVATLVGKMMTDERILGVEGIPRFWTSPCEIWGIKEQTLRYDFTHKKETYLTSCLWKSGMGQSSREDNK